MASVIVDHVHEGELSGSTPDTVEFRYGSFVTLQNLSAVKLRFTVDGSAPSVGGGNTYVCAPNSFRTMALSGNTRTIRVLGPADGTWAYTADTEPA